MLEGDGRRAQYTPLSREALEPGGVLAFDNENLDLLKETGLNEVAFFKVLDGSGPLPSSAALPSALLVSVSERLILSGIAGLSAVEVPSSEAFRREGAT